jgi:hypothetical protein
MKTKEQKRYEVSVHNASVIIDFLNRTFMPLHYFIIPSVLMKIKTSKDIFKKNDYFRPEEFDTARMSMGDLYQIYRIFRQQMDYTSPIESRYKFSRIVTKLQYFKNGWQFSKVRKTKAQLIYLYPVLLRCNVPELIKKDFPADGLNLSKAQVKLRVAGAGSLTPLAPEKKFVEAKWFIEAKDFVEVKAEWIETEYEHDE